MTHNVPEGVAYGTVYGEFMSFAADRADYAEGQDGIPDKIPITGYVLFTPRVETVQWPELNPPITAVIQDVRCPVIEGVLYPPGTTPETAASVSPGVVLVATEQPGAVPPTVQYNVTFDLKGTKRQPQSRPINIPSGDYIDLASLRSVTPEPGTVIIVSSEDRILAQEARIAAEGASAGASASLANAIISATEAAASASSASQSKNDASEAAQITVTSEAGAVAARIGAEEARDSAQGSATIASTGASSASSSATAAASSATNAATAATNATVAKTGAEVAADAAEQAVGVAAQHAGAAAGSAGDAATSATDAGLSAASAAAAISSTLWSGSVSLTPTPGGLIHATLTGDTTLGLVDLAPTMAVSVNLLVKQDATGGRKLTLEGAATAYGVAIDLTEDGGALDFLTLVWTGSQWLAFMGAANLLIPAEWVV